MFAPCRMWYCFIARLVGLGNRAQGTVTLQAVAGQFVCPPTGLAMIMILVQAHGLTTFSRIHSGSDGDLRRLLVGGWVGFGLVGLGEIILLRKGLAHDVSPTTTTAHKAGARGAIAAPVAFAAVAHTRDKRRAQGAERRERR